MSIIQKLQTLATLSPQAHTPVEWFGFKILPADLSKVRSPIDPDVPPINTFVPVSKLVPTERFYRRNQRCKEMAIAARKTKQFQSACVYRHKGHYYLIDGHHRASTVQFGFGFRWMPVTIVQLMPHSTKRRWAEQHAAGTLPAKPK